MDVREAIEGRRSIRRFTDEPVSDEDLSAMLRAATLAPSPSNGQQWHFVVVKNKGVLRQMRQAVETQVSNWTSFGREQGMLEEAKLLHSRLPGFIFFAEAPVAIAVCERVEPPDVRIRLYKAGGLSDADIARLLPSRGIQGISAAVENLVITAGSLGYGTCWMTGPLIAVRQMEEILGVQPPLRMIALIPVGRPAQSPSPRTRKPLEEVVTVID